MNISFTEKQEKYIRDKVKSGDFQNASEVVRNALRMVATYEERMVSELKAAIDLGWDDAGTSSTATDIAKEQEAKYATK